ncbi:hypothetical protein [Kribbella kalugense]|uniref:Uncharacterized protein n=1 Tax=Kribbella kalugense TaxID=2512221 RepID=A0A4R7ZTH3_9ACTN|nr:hypothetical protein [Kribbella kalugense]TDW21299.1 hypothetical protein EV650_0117 [Kribbella kalugense]
MTDTLTRHRADGKVRDDGKVRRLWRSVAYDALLVPAGLQTMADAVLGEPETAGRRWQRLAAYRLGKRDTAPVGVAGVGRVFGYGLITTVLGLASWFVMLLVLMSVVRGPFWGFVDHGAVEPGTWGGPTRAGAWTAHGLIAVPCVIAFLFALRGIAALQSLLVRPLYGPPSRKWVLPATIVLVVGSLTFFWSWLQQL